MSVRLIIMASLAGALGACAGGGGGRGGDRDAPIRALMSADALMFVGFDSNGDLSVAQAEMQEGMAREFQRADANTDGSLQPIEFSNWSNLVLGGATIGPYRLDFDRNVDNVITREEFDTEVRARFTSYDSDENGALSRGEFVRLIGQTRPPSPQRQPVPNIGPG